MALTREVHAAGGPVVAALATGLSWSPGLILVPMALAAPAGWSVAGETLVSETMALGLALALKPALGWPRPVIVDPTLGPMDPADPHGLPSAHTAAAFAAAASLTLAGSDLSSWAWLWATAVGWSRISLAQHGPIDVIAGAGLGLISAWAVRNTYPSPRP